MLDNVAVAILTKVNDLADRYGLKPYDFVAMFKHEEKDGKLDWVLNYEAPASGNAAKVEKFDKMLDTLGIKQDSAIRGSVEQIVDALDQALELAPRSVKR